MNKISTKVILICLGSLMFSCQPKDDSGTKSGTGSPIHDLLVEKSLKRNFEWSGTAYTASDYDWKKEAPNAGFRPQDIERLEKEKILISDQNFEQIFTPYIESSYPLFITTDSLLNGYHVLYEESIQQMEFANVPKLRNFLGLIWKNLPSASANCLGSPKLLAPAKIRSQIVLGVALRLLDPQFEIKDASIRKIVESEVHRVLEAKAQDKPQWLGPPEPDFLEISYSRFRPRGFYSGNPALEKYFRAISWLHAIPFRPSQDHELLAYWLMARSLELSKDQERARFDPESIESFLNLYSVFIGKTDDPDLTKRISSGYSLDFEKEPGCLEKFRKELLKLASSEGGSQTNDQVQAAPEDPDVVSEPQFRILSSFRTPDGALFQKTTDSRKISRQWPSGLEVASQLGSPTAKEELSRSKDGPILSAILDENRKLFKENSLYCEYLNCLAVLVAPPEQDAPAFIRTKNWEKKSCQTILAGWTQLRHTWVLQAKENVYYMGLTHKPAGFVEPNPEFYSRFAALLAKTVAILDQGGAFQASVFRYASEFRTAAQFFEDHQFTKIGKGAFRKFSGDDSKKYSSILSYVLMFPGRDIEDNGELKAEKPEEYAEIVKELRQMASDLESGKLSENNSFHQALKMMNPDLKSLWTRLEFLTRRLEALAHKQLRKKPFNDDENVFIKGYGEDLAGIMLYGGNSYLTPRDDAPRAVDVFENPIKKEFLIEAIGRPRPIYVLYPYEGKEVFCRGAVMPYYEFIHDQRLTDQEWSKSLDSQSVPLQPEWTASISSKQPLPLSLAREMADKKRDEEGDVEFMKCFPGTAPEIFEAYSKEYSSSYGRLEPEKEEVSVAKLKKLFPDEVRFGLASSKALGILSKKGVYKGSWRAQDAKIRLVLKCGANLKTGTFQQILSSKDEEVLLGAARLFFAEKLSDSLPQDLRGSMAAKLGEVVLHADHGRNVKYAIEYLDQIRSLETTALLERIALGEFMFNPDMKNDRDPSPRVFACLLLARGGSLKVHDCIKKVENSAPLDNLDKVFLLIARTFAGEPSLIEKEIFSIEIFDVESWVLEALEKEGSISSLDVLINGGLDRDGYFSDEKVIPAIERMTGKTWPKNEKNEDSKKRVKEIKEWWKKNRSSYRGKASFK